MFQLPSKTARQVFITFTLLMQFVSLIKIKINIKKMFLTLIRFIVLNVTCLN